MEPKPEYRHTAYRSPVGMIHLLASHEGLLAVGLNETGDQFKKRLQRRLSGIWKEVNPNQDEVLQKIVQSLRDFFHDGTPLQSDLRLVPTGTAFQQKVWRALRKIPHGRTATYGQIARRVGRPGAARAVGSACRSNPIALFIPCHRVIGATGDLCGFGGGGVDVKKRLLGVEGVK